MFLAATSAWPATLTVTSLADSGPGSLREALDTANTNGEPDAIGFSVSGTIELESTLIFSELGTSIDGGGSIVLDGSLITGSAPDAIDLHNTRDHVIENLSIIKSPRHGILMQGPQCKTCVIRGCFIGTNFNSDPGLGNGQGGIFLKSAARQNIIGGTTASDRNVISGNGLAGIVYWNEAASNTIIGNYIGTDASGTQALGNGIGVYMNWNMRTINSVGGTGPGEANVISGNVGAGVSIQRDGVSGSTVIGNFIGTDASGISPLPNGGAGVQYLDGVIDSVLGGTVAGEGNVIWFNAGPGVLIDGALTQGIAVRGNSIRANSGGGIVISNDANADASAPVVTGLYPVSGTAEDGAEIELFIDSAAQGWEFLGSATATGGTFSVAIDLSAHLGRNLTATATNAAGNTSEFSVGVEVVSEDEEEEEEEEPEGSPEVVAIQLGKTAVTDAKVLSFMVKFSEPVTGVNLMPPFDDFEVDSYAKTISGAFVMAVSGSGDSYVVMVKAGTGTGELGLTILASGGIEDLSGNPLTANYVSTQNYIVAAQAPALSAMMMGLLAGVLAAAMLVYRRRLV